MARSHNNAAQTIKLLSLLVICYGHIFMALTDGTGTGPLMGKWWVLGDIGLFFFTMSSAYYTALHYSTPQSMDVYWSRKVSRFGAQFLFINLILFCCFLVQGREGIFSPATLVNLLGLNGFFNWFHVRNTSPFGAGQWFITVLLLFYLAYPLINSICKSRGATSFLLFAAALTAVAGEFFFHYGHSLWSTSFGFAAGFYLCRNKPPRHMTLLWTFGILLALLAFRILTGASPVITYAVIAALGFVLGLLILPQDIPRLAFNSLLRPLDAIFLPLFLLHMYFFQYWFVAQPHINAMIILACNVILAKIVAVVYALFQKTLLSRLR